MNAIMSRTYVIHGLRVSFALLPVLALLSWMLGPAAPARADASTEPVARLQVVIKQVQVHDDRDGTFKGEGEIILEAEILRCNEGARVPCRRAAQPLARFLERNSADNGEVIALERIVPAANSSVDPSATAELGFPVYAGARYVVWFSAWEDDGYNNGHQRADQMGEVFQVITADRLDEAFGVHVTRSFRGDGETYGDYTITWEVRPAPLADLRPGSPTVQSLPGTPRTRVCMPVTNAGSGGAGRFDVALRVNSNTAVDGQVGVPDLAPGSSVEPCVELVLPPAGHVTLVTEVDVTYAVAEYNETNNVLSSAYQATGPAPSPTATPSVAQADLIVSAIKVNGREPDGKKDCEDGKNDVTVVVKNAGTDKAGAFDVQLVVDPVEKEAFRQLALVESVSGVEAGQEQEVRFEDVRLKKGQRTLAARADFKSTVAESKEDNNALKVTAACKDDD